MSMVNSDGSQNASQDTYTMCENSSAYESSEDTGIGGLSESEQLMGVHDGEWLKSKTMLSRGDHVTMCAFDDFRYARGA